MRIMAQQKKKYESQIYEQREYRPRNVWNPRFKDY